jgi:hypothetical protein
MIDDQFSSLCAVPVDNFVENSHQLSRKGRQQRLLWANATSALSGHYLVNQGLADITQMS